MASTLLTLLLLCVPVLVHAVTADDLRNMSSDIDRDQQASSSRAKSDDLQSLIGEEDKNVTPAKKDHTTKPGRKHFKKVHENGKSVPPAAAPAASAARATATLSPEPETSHQPVPGSQSMISDAVQPVKSFGIRLGTWIEGKIDRNTSNAEPGSVEITLTGNVVGDKKTLKAGTILFGPKQLNNATKRLEIMVDHGITPDGVEFDCKGSVYDTHKVSGLQGIIDYDKDSMVKRGASKGALSAASAAARNLAGNTPAGAAIGGASDSMINDQSNIVEQQTSQQPTIYVGPQPLLIRIDKTF